MKVLTWLNPCKSRANKANTQTPEQVTKADENVKLLLECEQKAKLIVTNAQERRKESKLRVSKEADKELVDFRKEREKKFQKYCTDANKDTEKAKGTIASDIDKKIKTIDEQVKKHKDKVIKMLLENVVKIEPRVHRNLHPKKKVNSIMTQSTQSIKE